MPRKPDRAQLDRLAALGLIPASKLPDKPRPEKARQEEAAPDAAPVPEPSGVAKKLRILERHMSVIAKGAPQPQAPWEVTPDEYAAPLERVLEGFEQKEEAGSFFLVRRDYPLSHRQGLVALESALAARAEHVAFSAADPLLAGFDARRTVFIDTETTGLAGGSGTLAFLVGVGYFEGDVFRLDQCFLRDYHEEEAMLQYLSRLFERFDAMVSYNGKSFDLPLLRTRFVQNRLPFQFGEAAHYDLVHASRRFYKRRLRDCSLGNIEREILSLMREGDVPSYLIPQMWFEYLRSGDARPLDAVFYHHRMDILSLVCLTGWLSQCLDAPEGAGFAHAEDCLSMVRLHFQQRNYEQAAAAGKVFLEREPVHPLRRECLRMMALAFKRRKEWEAMQEAWEQLCEEFEDDVEALLELAKHHEHRTRDLFRAEELAQRALDIVREQYATGAEPSLGVQGAKMLAERVARITKKLAKARARLEDNL